MNFFALRYNGLFDDTTIHKIALISVFLSSGDIQVTFKLTKKINDYVNACNIRV